MCGRLAGTTQTLHIRSYFPPLSVFCTESHDRFFSIQDGGLSLSWGLQGEDVEEGQNVYVPDSGPAPNQDWRLIATLPPSY